MRITRMGLLTGLIVVLALWVGSLVTRMLPAPSDVYERPYVESGSLGEQVTTRAFDVTVTGVRAGPEAERDTTVAATTGVWLVVDFTLTARGETFLLPVAEVRIEAADGRQFGGVPGLTASCRRAQVGIAQTCSIPFEVPPDAIEGAHVLIPASYVTAMDDVAVIDLGISGEEATDLAASTERQQVPEAVPVGG